MKSAVLNDLLSDREEMISYIRDVLMKHRRSNKPVQGLRPSAVLIPLCWIDKECHILFTKRSMNVEHHKGEISFPGGTSEPEDTDLIATALREAHEEVGLRPETVDVLGFLDDHSSLMGYHITPVVGTIPFPYEFAINDESESLIYLPLRHALADTAWMKEWFSFRGWEGDIFFIQADGGVIWGATARMLKLFVEILRGKKLVFSPVSREAKDWVAQILSTQKDYQSNKQ
ncbi:MAG: CoA pyrophosphatase [Deltaproteobacteria bacterium]|nr:CoA pyrophosphatase [Deltaproteobacteria bacterium]